MTPAGSLYLKESFALFSSHQALLQRCREKSQGVLSITIGSLPNLTSIALPKICREYHRQRQEVKFCFRDFPRDFYFEQLRENRFSLTAEYIMNYHQHEEDLCFLPLRKARHYLGVLPDSPLARKEKLGFSDLRGHTLALYKPGVTSSEDELRAYLMKNEPDIKLLDISDYDSALIAQCMVENALVLLYTAYWQNFASFVCVPAAWDIPITLGLGYRRDAGQEIQQFLQIAYEMNAQGRLFT